MKLKLRNSSCALLMTLTLAFSAITILAPKTVLAAPQPVAEAELKALFQKYADIERLSVDFDQTKTLKDVPTKLKSKGHLEVRSPDSLTWTVSKPSFLEFKLVKGDAQITTGQGEEAVVQKITKAQMASSAQAKSLDGLASWLKFDSNFLTREYTVVKDEKAALEFTPKTLESSPFTKIQLEFSKNQTVRHLILTEKSGDVIELEFQNPLIQKKRAR